MVAVRRRAPRSPVEEFQLRVVGHATRFPAGELEPSVHESAVPAGQNLIERFPRLVEKTPEMIIMQMLGVFTLFLNRLPTEDKATRGAFSANAASRNF